MGIRVTLARSVTENVPPHPWSHYGPDGARYTEACEVIGNISHASWNRLQVTLWNWCATNQVTPFSPLVDLCDHSTNDPEAIDPARCEALYYELSFLLDVDINTFTDFEHNVLDALRRAARIAVVRSWSLVLA